MKHVIVMALGAALALASCVSKGTVVKVEEQRDSLSVVVSAKDSLISAVFEDISSISENLALIRTRENLLSVAGDAEGGRRPVEEINNDIAAIDRLLRENKVKIASLQSAVAQLRKANLRLDGLEKMIRDMSAQLAEKKNEIARLRENLTQMGVEVETLTEQVAVRSEQVETLNTEKVELENQLNTVYYIVGTEKELREAQIINKQGFIGRTLTVNKTNNLDSFTKTDSRLLSEVPIGQKKVSVVTTHPEESYELVTDADKVVLSYLFRPAEKNFPAFFCDALVARLAAEFCLPLTESSSRAEYLAKKAEDELARARLTDSQQATPRRFEDFTLVEIRR